MATAYIPRPMGRIRTLGSDMPHVPTLNNESSFDAVGEAKKLVSSFNHAVESANWEEFGRCFDDKCWWKDNFSLSFDKRTIRGREEIVKAWKKFSPSRTPEGFAVVSAASKIEMVETNPTFMRMSPTFATLDVPVSFRLANPSSVCVGIMKFIPVGDEWKIWVLSTAIHSLSAYPFSGLPRTTSSKIQPSQRGVTNPQGPPKASGVLDAVMIGGSYAGLANGIMLEAAGLDIAILEAGDAPGWRWIQRYKSVRLHHNALQTQLPFLAAQDGLSDFMSGTEIGIYYAKAVEQLKLSFFAGIRVLKNSWDSTERVWHVLVEDTRSQLSVGQTTLKAKNLVVCNGFIVPEDKPLIPKGLMDHGEFNGPVQHSTEYYDANPYNGKRVVVVGISNSAHDIAKDLYEGGAASVTMLQRSPIPLFDFKTLNSMMGAPYQGQLGVETADFLGNAMPTGIFRDIAFGGMQMLIQKSEPLYSKLEAKGYRIDRKPNIMEKAYEQRGHSFYFDAPGVFDLVLADKIHVIGGEAMRFTKQGLAIKKPYESDEKMLEADGVVLATGYANSDLPQEYANSGFLDKATASKMTNVGKPGVNIEGEPMGQVAGSGHPNLYFCAIGFSITRLLSRFVAVQIIADVHGIAPEYRD